MTERLSAAQYRDATKAPKKGRFPRSPVEQRTLGGIVFDSKREMLRWVKLEEKQKHGLIFDLKRQVTYAVEINGIHFCKYTPDAEYKTAEGLLVFEDTKSTGTRKDAAYRLRKKAFEIYFGVQVTEVLKP